MKIGYITHLPNLTGANRSLLDMLDGLDKEKYTPFVLLNGHGPLEGELKKRNIEYKISFYSPATNSDHWLKNLGKAAFNCSLMNWISVQMIKKILIEEKVDLVHNNSYIVGAGMEAAKAANIPYICHIREFVWEDHHRKFFNEKRQTGLLQNADMVLAITQAVKNKFQPQVSSEIIVLLDGIRVDEYKLPYKEVFKDEQINILMAGRIAPGKGQMEAIQAVERLVKDGYTNVVLHVVGGVGDDKYNKEIHQYVQEHNLTAVKFYEFTNSLKDMRQQCDIGLTCSKAEGLGRVTVENNLSSLLVVAAEAAGTKELIEDGKTGLFYKPGDAAHLAAVLKKAIDNPQVSNQIVKNGYEDAVKYDYVNYGRQIMKIYEQMENLIKN